MDTHFSEKRERELRAEPAVRKAAVSGVGVGVLTSMSGRSTIVRGEGVVGVLIC